MHEATLHESTVAAGSERLSIYRERRNFERTPEPAGGIEPVTPAETASRRFVVQRHRARRLHYDLRFEIDGVLVSWAVPKGPTLDPAAKHAAVHVEDHPIEYLHFEGVIPKGEYGGGDVIVWDTGTWTPHGTTDPAAAVAAGELHAEMHGQKLRGRLVLVRRGTGGDDGKQQWLLLHKRDRYAMPGWDPEEHRHSVLSGRTNEEVAADPARIWRSDLPPAQASIELKKAEATPGYEIQAETHDAVGRVEALRGGGTAEVYGRRLRLTNLDKPLFPGRNSEPPVTKQEFVAYAALIAPFVLPYLTGRALNMHRYPDGAAGTGFWHKQLPAHAPTWLGRWKNPDADPGETSTYLVVDEPAALVWAANFGALEWHAWTSRTDQPQLPDYALVDIDPGTTTSWEQVVTLARLHRTALDHLGVRAQPKVTGRRGIQIWIPVSRGPSFDDTRGWVQQLSKAVGAVVPELISWKWDVQGRSGLARLDYTQNAINKTLVSPYSPRAAAGAPVSAPIEWDELDDPDLRPDAFTIRTIGERLAARGDPFRAVLDAGQRLPPLQ